MVLIVDEPTKRAARWSSIGVVVCATLIAAISARDYAGGWNDGSRLATVEALVDQHTLAIDRTIFVRTPEIADTAPNPYAPADDALRQEGTKDKLFIAGHYYSDKSPVPAVVLAGWYQLLQSTTGLVARERPRLFCYLMTIGSSGLAYVVAVWSVDQLSKSLGSAIRHRVLLAASLGLATLALPYARHVNNHIALLAIVGLLMLTLHHAANISGQKLWWRLCQIGMLAGLGYTFDLGMGPVLLLCTAGWAWFRTRRVWALLGVALAALPWLAAHHALNYSVGGTWSPANARPEYLSWPGSPFSTANMTGGWAHRSIGHFLLYAAALLIGKHGFVNHNLPLYLCLPGIVLLWRTRRDARPELAFAAALAGGTWLLYAAASNNYSGPCCSIRWFVPLLAPAFYVLALLLRERPSTARDLALLSLFGAALSAVLWWRGPWQGEVLPEMWVLNALALAAWVLATRWRRRLPASRRPTTRPTISRRR